MLQYHLFLCFYNEVKFPISHFSFHLQIIRIQIPKDYHRNYSNPYPPIQIINTTSQCQKPDINITIHDLQLVLLMAIRVMLSCIICRYSLSSSEKVCFSISFYYVLILIAKVLIKNETQKNIVKELMDRYFEK